MSVHCQKIVLVRGHVAETHFDSYLSQKQHRLFRGPTLFAMYWLGGDRNTFDRREKSDFPAFLVSMSRLKLIVVKS